MTFPYLPLFAGLLAGYVIWSVWARLDPRLPVFGALVLLVATAVADAAGATAAANALATYVFLLLAGGLVLLLVDHVRGARRPVASGPVAHGPAGPSADPGDRPAEQGLDHAQ